MIADELIIKVMADTRDAVVNLQKLTQGAEQGKKAAGGLGDTFAKLRDVMQGPVAAFQMATRVIGDLWNTSQAFFDAYAYGERTVLQFNAALGASSQLYVGATERIEEYIQKIKDQTYYGDDLLREQAALLASYGRTEDQIKKILEVSADYSMVTGKDMATSVKYLSGTLSGLLGELGETQTYLRDLTVEELQAGKGIEQVGKRFKDSAESIRQSSGYMKRDMADMVADMQEDIGALIASIQTAVMEAAALAVEMNRSIFGTTGKAAEKTIEDLRAKGAEGVANKTQALKALEEFRGEAARIESKMASGAKLTEYEALTRRAYNANVIEITKYINELMTLTKQEQDAAAAAEERARRAAAARREAEDAAAKAEEAAEAERAFQLLLTETWIELKMNILEAGEEVDKIADTMEEIVDFSQAFADEFDRIAEAENAAGGGAVGTVNNLAEAYQNLQKAMGGGMESAPILEAQKALMKGGMNPQFDWKGTGGDAFDMYQSPQVGAINAGMAELRIQQQVDDILGDKATKAREIVGLYRQAEQIETIAAQTAREKAEAEKAFAAWQEQWIGQLGSTGIDILMEAAHALDVAHAVGWEDAAKGFDEYMVRFVDQLPMMLLTAGLQVIGVNFPVGLALIVASGLVALVDAATTSAAEQAAYSSSTAGSGGGSGGGGGITINQYVQGSIWERRALEATAVRAAEKAGRGW